MPRWTWLAGMLCGCLLLGGCDEEEDLLCVAGTGEGCDDGMVCETVEGGDPACFIPVRIEGRVFDATDDQGIGGATVVALDANGSARTTVVTTADDGSYSLPIAMQRTGDGKLATKEFVTLRVSALGYQTFPLAPRTALPIQIDTAVEQDNKLVVANAATDVALIPLAGGSAGLGTIIGTIDTGGLEDLLPGGVLVVAELGGKAVSTAVSDTHGDFTLFNVPAGTAKLGGYRAGINVTPADVTVSGDVVKDVVLLASRDGLATVTGSVNIVNAPGGATTSVLLVVESTFDDATKRGESPAGMRAENVSSDFTIVDVSPGKYVVLAAFENDDLVRDPDESIGGTAIVRIDVNGGTVDTGTSFKVTEALAVVSPGANDVEVIKTAEPVFVWADDSSEDGFELRVFDALGEMVHEDLNVPKVSGSPNVSYTWTGAAMTAGMIYQFRAVSWRDAKAGGSRTYISATEDLRGVFQYLP
jgi:uncharacterized protein (DUF2141 family)